MKQNYAIGNKYLIISKIVIQSNKYTINKITMGTLVKVTDKCYNFVTDTGKKRIRKTNICKMIDVSLISIAQTQFLLDRIEGALL